MGTPLPLSKKGEPPKFSAHVYCGQTAGLINMELGTEAGLSPGNFVLDGDPAPPQKGGGASQIFGPCLLWPNGWMNQDSTWHGGRPRRLCVRWGPSHLSQNRVEPLPQFFGPFLLWPNGWMHQDASAQATLMATQPLFKKGRSPSLIFGPCLLWSNGTDST